jgi:quinol monooxygenase YgiN
MEFIQIIESRTKDIDAMLALEQEWEQATEGKRTVRRSIVTRDRNDPDRHLIIVFFDSYESAMQNSQMPETQELSAKMGTLVEGESRFYDLDVIKDRS